MRFRDSSPCWRIPLSVEVRRYQGAEDRKSSVLRQMNMDKANLSRSVESCVKQIEDILLIDEEIGLKRLPKPCGKWRGPAEQPGAYLGRTGQTLIRHIKISGKSQDETDRSKKLDSLRNKYKRE